jgi:hypothetical protein
VFAGWFSPTIPTEDRVWLDAAACTRGLQRDVTQALDQGHAVLLLLRNGTHMTDMAQALAERTPKVCDDRYAATDLRPHLAVSSALGISMVEALRPLPAADDRTTPLHVHIRSRGDRRSDDHRLLEALKAWAPASIVFHHALDDRLLRDHTSALKPLLARLGLGADEAVSSAMIGRAIQRVQRP